MTKWQTKRILTENKICATLTIVSKYGTGTPHKTINKQINFTNFD